MSRFVSTNDTRVIRADWWDEGEQVVIRKWTIAQRDRLNERIIRITGGTADEGLTEMQIMAAQVPVLEAGIESWTFEDEGGKRVLPSPQNISRLQPRDADYIVSEIWDFNRQPTEDEQRSFPSEGTAGGEGEGQ